MARLKNVNPLNGQDIIRAVGLNTKPLTEKQLFSNLKMAVAMDFFSGLETLLQRRFAPETNDKIFKCSGAK